MAGWIRSKIGIRRISSTSCSRDMRSSFLCAGSQQHLQRAAAVAQFGHRAPLGQPAPLHHQYLLEALRQVVVLEHPQDALTLAVLENAREHPLLRRWIEHCECAIENENCRTLEERARKCDLL